MADPRSEALDRGDLPNASGLRGHAIACLGLAGAVSAAFNAPWFELSELAFGLGGEAKRLVEVGSTCLGWVATGALAGALVGLLISQKLAGAWAPKARFSAYAGQDPQPFWLRSLWLSAAAVGLWLGPWWAARLTGGDGGWALIMVPLMALAACTGFAVPIALLDRAVARARWIERVDPEDAPPTDAERREGFMKRAFGPAGRRARDELS